MLMMVEVTTLPSRELGCVLDCSSWWHSVVEVQLSPSRSPSQLEFVLAAILNLCTSILQTWTCPKHTSFVFPSIHVRV
jgi:hypothetical protein